jgi:hypothetical protein
MHPVLQEEGRLLCLFLGYQAWADTVADAIADMATQEKQVEPWLPSSTRMILNPQQPFYFGSHTSFFSGFTESCDLKGIRGTSWVLDVYKSPRQGPSSLQAATVCLPHKKYLLVSQHHSTNANDHL